jgi:hypothetical protein
MIIARFFCLIVFALCASSVVAQTCASPIQITTTGTITGTTCSGTSELPSLVNGSMTGGQQIVHRITLAPGASPGIELSLQPDAGADMSLFVCSNMCSPAASCIAAVDDNDIGGVETASLPNTPGDYYIIVQTSAGETPACGGYSLTVASPL